MKNSPLHIRVDSNQHQRSNVYGVDEEYDLQPLVASQETANDNQGLILSSFAKVTRFIKCLVFLSSMTKNASTSTLEAIIKTCKEFILEMAEAVLACCPIFKYSYSELLK